MYLCFSEADLRPLPDISWSSVEAQLSTVDFVTKSTILNVAGILDPPMPKPKRW